ARIAAGAIFSIIHRIPAIDSTGDQGKRITSATETPVQLDEVRFSYPFRNSNQVLKGVSIDALRGQTIALVGPSGSGKSSIISLIERFYDVSSGSIKVHGTDVRDLNTANLRHQMSLVEQEPILFDGTIAENIAWGLAGPTVVTEEMIKTAAKLANAENFVGGLEQGYETQVGEGGALLSGGQKQRIAIARALIRDPRILLLDEATSALDSESEKVVQSALDGASKGRTTIVIAHRLSSIQSADRIFVVQGGQVQETGSHAQLMEKKGLYYELAQQQTLGVAREENA
ncbi:putative P-glyco protein 5, partial [Gonapodya prolifera JEL478]